MLNLAQRIDKLNLVLLDIIEKLQDQNKKNQIFLNKALLSLQELKDSFAGGEKKFKTYGANGNTYSSVR
jgi:flagellar biosynthesis/type III secretory pathway chaperone